MSSRRSGLNFGLIYSVVALINELLCDMTETYKESDYDCLLDFIISGDIDLLEEATSIIESFPSDDLCCDLFRSAMALARNRRPVPSATISTWQ